MKKTEEWWNSLSITDRVLVTERYYDLKKYEDLHLVDICKIYEQCYNYGKGSLKVVESRWYEILFDFYINSIKEKDSCVIIRKGLHTDFNSKVRDLDEAVWLLEDVVKGEFSVDSINSFLEDLKRKYQ